MAKAQQAASTPKPPKATISDGHGNVLAEMDENGKIPNPADRERFNQHVRGMIQRQNPDVPLSKHVQEEQDQLLGRVQHRADTATEKVSMHVALGQDIVRAKIQHRETGDMDKREEIKKAALVQCVRLLEVIGSALADLQGSAKDALAELKELGFEPAEIKQLMAERRVSQLELDLSDANTKKRMKELHGYLDEAKMYRPGNAEVEDYHNRGGTHDA